MSSNLLELKNICKRYGSPESRTGMVVLKDISLTLKPGESVSFVGPSGCGKSTLLNLLGALDRPTSGSITLAGRDLGNLAEAELAAIRNREIGFVFQQHHLMGQCTVLENVLIPIMAGKLTRELRRSRVQRAEKLLEKVGLSSRRDHRPGQLSGGEAQRTAVVRALISEPKLLLADEPTGSLDQNSAHRLGDLLVELNRDEGVTLVVVTHNPALAQRMKTVYELKDGRLAGAGPAAPDDNRHRTSTPQARTR